MIGSARDTRFRTPDFGYIQTPSCVPSPPYKARVENNVGSSNGKSWEDDLVIKKEKKLLTCEGGTRIQANRG